MSEEPKRKTKSLVQLRTQRFPGALFLEDSILLRAEADWREQRNIGGDLEGRSSLVRKVRGEIRRLVDEHNQSLMAQAYEREGVSERTQLPNDTDVLQDEMPLPEDARLEFIEYREVQGIPGYDMFLCREPSCERLFKLEDALKTDFLCPIHKRSLSQLAHLFVHNVCGHIEMIRPEKCWNPGCDATMRLHLYPPNMRRSYWWCPECRKKGMPERARKRADGDWSSAWKRDLFKYCPVCRARARANAQLDAIESADDDAYDPSEEIEDPGGRVRMGLTTARTVFKPMTLTTVDILGADEDLLLDAWFQVGLNTEAVRADLPEYLRAQFDSDSKLRQRILQAKKSEGYLDNGDRINPPQRVREVLRDYAGARLRVRERLGGVRSEQADYLLDTFGVRVSIVDGLAVINATYGYLIGSSDPSQAKLDVFHMGGDRYAVLTQRLETEAMLIELDPEKVRIWLLERGYPIPMREGDSPAQSIRRFLLMRLTDDEILQEVVRLVHTMSHLLIRTSERVTGISRDNLQEIVWPRALAFVLYNGNGSDLGMLQTAFEGSMLDWFHGARHNAANCPYDPVCRNSDIAACHACLFIAERNCNTYWNRWLDRRHLITFDNGPVGYWGALA